MSRSAATRRYNRRVILASAAYALFLFMAVYAFKHELVSGPLAYLVALLPGLAVSAIFVAIGRLLVEEQDEYVRMLMVRQTLWATGIALTAATIWGFFENFDLVGHIDTYYIAIVWFGGLGVGSCINKLAPGRPS